MQPLYVTNLGNQREYPGCRITDERVFIQRLVYFAQVQGQDLAGLQAAGRLDGKLQLAVFVEGGKQGARIDHQAWFNLDRLELHIQDYDAARLCRLGSDL